jgi:hypothetical protein
MGDLRITGQGIVTQEWVTYALLGKQDAFILGDIRFSRAQRERLRDTDGSSLQFIEI